MKRTRVFALLTLVALLAISVYGCGGQESDTTETTTEATTETTTEATTETTAEAKGPITVGSKEFTEQLILGQVTLLALEDKGFEVKDNTGLQGSDVVRGALTSGDIDLYWEYTGTAWISYLKHDTPITDSQECYDKVKEEDAANDLAWLDYAPLNNTYTIMMKQEKADELGISSLSDLAAYLNKPDHEQIVFATNHEFSIRDDGLLGVYDTYGFEFDDVATMDSGITYDALKNGEAQAAMGFATDGRIKAFGFVNLTDDKHFFPAYNVAPVVRQEVLDKYPEIAEVLNPIAAELDDATMSDLNYQVDSEHQVPKDVAEKWLRENGLIE